MNAASSEIQGEDGGVEREFNIPRYLYFQPHGGALTFEQTWQLLPKSIKFNYASRKHAGHDACHIAICRGERVGNVTEIQNQMFDG